MQNIYNIKIWIKSFLNLHAFTTCTVLHGYKHTTLGTLKLARAKGLQQTVAELDLEIRAAPPNFFHALNLKYQISNKVS
jgi:hypothetical protein